MVDGWGFLFRQAIVPSGTNQGAGDTLSKLNKHNGIHSLFNVHSMLFPGVFDSMKYISFLIPFILPSLRLLSSIVVDDCPAAKYIHSRVEVDPRPKADPAVVSVFSFFPFFFTLSSPSLVLFTHPVTHDGPTRLSRVITGPFLSVRLDPRAWRP